MFLRISSFAAAAACSLIAIGNAAAGGPSLVDDRTAIELVYYNHRLGTKPPFRDILKASQIEKMVALDSKKEIVLKGVYGVAITAAMIDAEVQRIDASTRAPEVLAELKAAVGNDPGRFARSVVRPIVVERMLRARYENDDKLHAGERVKVEDLRKRLLSQHTATYQQRFASLEAAKLGNAAEITWQLRPRPPGDPSPPAPSAPPAATENKARSGAYSIEATAQVAQVLSSPEESALDHDRALYFEDLPPELEHVLRAQLVHPGDVSAVIETTQGFFLYLARERTVEALAVAVLSVPKRSYEAWLAKQPD
jgi:hypothetical protein